MTESIYWATLPDGTEIISTITSGLRQGADDCGHLGHIAIRTRAPTKLELERLTGARYAIRTAPDKRLAEIRGRRAAAGNGTVELRMVQGSDDDAELYRHAPNDITWLLERDAAHQEQITRLRSLCAASYEIMTKHDFTGSEDTALCAALDLLAMVGIRHELQASEIQDLTDALRRHGP